MGMGRDGAAPGPPVLGLRPLLGHSSAFQATTGPSGGHTETKAGQLEAIWLTWSRGWRIQQARRRQLTLSMRTSPTQVWASKPTRMDSSTQLSLDESLLVTSAWRCLSPSKPVQTMSFRPLTTHQKRKKGELRLLTLMGEVSTPALVCHSIGLSRLSTMMKSLHHHQLLRSSASLSCN